MLLPALVMAPDRSSTFLRILVPVAMLAAAGCDGPTGRPAEAPGTPTRGAKTDGVGAVRGDVSLLLAEVGGETGTERAVVDPGNCMRLEGGFSDCTHALELATGRPALHEVIVDRRDGQKFDCKLLRVRTVSALDVVDEADGIGFSYEGYGAGAEDRFVAAEELSVVEVVRFADGTPAEVHEFVGVADCWMGGVEETEAAEYTFKPFMGYVEDDGSMIREWDRALEDYHVGNGVESVDRSDELLE